MVWGWEGLQEALADCEGDIWLNSQMNNALWNWSRQIPPWVDWSRIIQGKLWEGLWQREGFLERCTSESGDYFGLDKAICHGPFTQIPPACRKMYCELYTELFRLQVTLEYKSHQPKKILLTFFGMGLYINYVPSQWHKYMTVPIPIWPQCTWSQTGFFNITVSSLYSNDYQVHKKHTISLFPCKIAQILRGGRGVGGGGVLKMACLAGRSCQI